MSNPAWIDHVLSIAQRVDDWLGAQPLYALSRSMSNMQGLSAPGLCGAYEATIRAAGRWRGPGIAVLVDCERVGVASLKAAAAAELGACASRVEAKLAIAGVVLHEVAHAIRDNDQGDSKPIGGDPDMARRALEQITDRPLTARDMAAMPSTATPWAAGHDLPFIRAVLHLRARAAKAGICGLRPDHVFHAERYALSPTEAYEDALASELRASAGPIIAKVFFTKPPRAFRDLWRRDVLVWHDSLKSPSRQQTADVYRALQFYK